MRIASRKPQSSSPSAVPQRCASLCFLATLSAVMFLLGVTFRPLLSREARRGVLKDVAVAADRSPRLLSDPAPLSQDQSVPVFTTMRDNPSLPRGGGILKSSTSDAPQLPRFPATTSLSSSSSCEVATKQHYLSYFQFSQRGSSLQATHGTLKIACFSRLWVPPIHGTGGMQYHALHLYSQLAARGHYVHVFVTGHPHGPQKTLHFRINPATLHLEEEADHARARLIVQQVPSDKNGEYSETWFENCFHEFRRVNQTVGGFHVAHSESWAGVPNVYQIGLQMLVTWHGSMLDWFRNEINLIVHNFRMKGKMTGTNTASRMQGLGSSVAYEAYMLLAVPHHVVISDSAAKDLKEINLLDPDSIHLIYNGVNPQNFKPADNRQQLRLDFLREHHVDVNDVVVGCGGRLDAIKGHHQLSQAMRKLLPQYKNMTLLVAGSGGESTRYESMQREGFKVVLLGMLPQQKLATFYQSLDIFVDPFYQHHGLNTVMLEAVLSGVPIVATRLASAQTTAPCEAYGRTFGLGKVDELAEQVRYLAQHPEERARIGRNVRERALRLFSSEVMAGSYESLFYDALLHPKKLEPLTGKVVCRHTYPAMCYREPQ